MKITIEIGSFDELAQVKEWLNLAPEPLKHDLSVTTENLGLTERTKNCLLAEKIHTLKDLLEWSEIDLLKTPNLGRKSLSEIHKMLASKGLTLWSYMGKNLGE